AEYDHRVVAARQLEQRANRLRQELQQFQPRAFAGRTLVIDDEDLQRVTLLKEKRGHGDNPAGTQRGYRDDVGGADHVGNLSRGRYTWWTVQPGEEVFTWNPNVAGQFRLWISWGVHGSGVHTRDARYVLDRDGDLSTRDDQTEIARADQYRFANVSEGESEKKPLWSGLWDAGVHSLQPTTRLVLRGGQTGTGITADVLVLQEDIGQQQPRMRPPVNAGQTVESFAPTPARFVRFTSYETIDQNRHEPCLDELEVFAAGDPSTNIALAKHGTQPTSSGNYANSGKHQLKHINDGRYGNGHSWISNQRGGGWVQLEFPRAATIDRVVWGRDRQDQFQDRLPVRYRIETSLDGTTWKTVASSQDRLPRGAPHDDVQLILQSGKAENESKLADLMSDLRQCEQQRQNLPKPKMVYAGLFRPAQSTFVLRLGDPEQPGKPISPRVLSALGELTLSEDTPEQDRRKALASWIASPDNPLTARVMVNRVWQHHFGVGLVETSSDFGLNGSLPTHPQLLDWLSDQFIRSGWSVKHLHRLILASQTYQQSSVWLDRNVAAQRHPATIDADVKLLWKFPSRRLEAEAIRDCVLHVSGQLNLEAGGPGFDFFKSRGGLSGFPPLEQFGADQLRRMIYAHKIRMERVPVFGAFDCPDAGLPTPRRSQSTTAIQALNLFNSPFVIDQAELFASRVENQAGVSVSDQVDLAYRLALGRSPRQDERAAVENVVRTHGLPTLCRVLFNSSEFLFIP
ncbi:MAG: DUF1553 domain-containing protein, partial [Pirellulales bacterium]|nr:DUF1553 domain-containing protein [Pirellulales bacterium]